MLVGVDVGIFEELFQHALPWQAAASICSLVVRFYEKQGPVYMQAQEVQTEKKDDYVMVKRSDLERILSLLAKLEGSGSAQRAS